MQFSVLPLAVVMTVVIMMSSAYAVNDALCDTAISNDYTFTGNIDCSTSLWGNAAISIAHSNVTLDCAGYSLIGNPDDRGIRLTNSNFNNITIKNCNISGFDIGIEGFADNLTIFNNTLENVKYGLLLSNRGEFEDCNYIGSHYIYSNANITSNTIYGTGSSNGGSGIDIRCFSDSQVIDNKIYTTGNEWAALDVGYGNNNVVANNFINNSGDSGLELDSDADEAFCGEVYNNTVNYVEAGDGWRDLGAALYLNGNFTDSCQVNIYNNTFSNSVYGVFADGGDGTPENMNNSLRLWNNNIFNNSNLSVYSSHPEQPWELFNNNLGNYWGHSCPDALFTAGVDSSSENFTDNYPYGEADGWLTGSPGCAPGDIDAPTINISTILSNKLLNDTVMPINITGTASDDINVTNINFYVDGTLVGNVTELNLPNWHQLWNPNDGVYNLTFKACDAAGNCTNATITNITVDVTKCGDTITSNFMMLEDLECNGLSQVGYGLSVGANDVTLDCAGHSITGNGTGIGVKFNGVSGATIKNCKVSGFAQGILSGNAATASNYILNNTVHDNSQYGIGIRQATDYTIAYNNVSYSGVGIRIVSSSGNEVYGNTVTNTTGAIGHGIDMAATSFGNTIRDNTLETNNVSIFSTDSHDNVIRNNTIISPANNGIHLYDSGYSNVTDNNISNAIINGIFIEAATGPLSNNLVRGNTISLSETDTPPFTKFGIRMEDDNNEIYNNTIDCTIKSPDYPHVGIWISGSGGNAENNVFSGNEIFNCDYGFDAWDADYFEVSDEDYHNNSYGAYLQSAGTSSAPPLIANSRIYDNSHGVYLTMGSYANISNTNFTDNAGTEGGPESGIHVQGGSTAYVTNGRFIDNGEYGIYDIVLNDHVYWTINGNALCRNNNVKINGSITFDGGTLELDNCTIFLNGAELDITGNITSLDQTQAEVEANTTSGELNFTASNASITLNLAENVTATVIVLPVTPNASGTTASLTALKGIEITVDNATRGNLTWALIKIFYNESELTAANITESTLKIYYYNTTATAWQLEPNQGVNAADNYVWANVTHFSTFGAFGSALIAALAPSGGGGGGFVYQLANTSTFQMFSGDTVRFAVGSQNHSALLLHVYSSYVTMRISSATFDVNLSANAIQKVDVNNDSIYDLAMTLKNMTGTKATIQFEKISEPVPAVAPPTPPPAAPPAAPPTGAVITPEVNITAPAVLPTNITAPTVPPAATPIILPRALIIELLFIAAIAAALLVAVRSTHRKYKAHRGHTHPWYRGQGAVPAKLIM